MNRIPAQNYAGVWPADDRPAPPREGTGAEVLNAYLDWHRTTLEAKCEGLTAEQLSTRAVPASSLSLHGLVRHLTGVERWWFRIQFAGEDVPLLYYSDDDPDQDFDDLDGDPAEAFAAWRVEVARSREIVAAAGSLDETGTEYRSGRPVQLRSVLVKLIAEYARHNGHADLLRESIDGATGL